MAQNRAIASVKGVVERLGLGNRHQGPLRGLIRMTLRHNVRAKMAPAKCGPSKPRYVGDRVDGVQPHLQGGLQRRPGATEMERDPRQSIGQGHRGRVTESTREIRASLRRDERGVERPRTQAEHLQRAEDPDQVQQRPARPSDRMAPFERREGGIVPAAREHQREPQGRYYPLNFLA